MFMLEIIMAVARMQWKEACKLRNERCKKCDVGPEAEDTLVWVVWQYVPALASKLAYDCNSGKVPDFDGEGANQIGNVNERLDSRAR